MITITCDREGCKKPCEHDRIQLHGYYPKTGGILIPEQFRHFDFCSHDCFVNWMALAMKKEPNPDYVEAPYKTTTVLFSTKPGAGFIGL